MTNESFHMIYGSKMHPHKFFFIAKEGGLTTHGKTSSQSYYTSIEDVVLLRTKVAKFRDEVKNIFTDIDHQLDELHG